MSGHLKLKALIQVKYCAFSEEYFVDGMLKHGSVVSGPSCVHVNSSFLFPEQQKHRSKVLYLSFSKQKK